MPFERVGGLYEMGTINSDQEKPLDSDKTKEIYIYKFIQKGNTALYQHLYSAISSYPINELTWKDPLTSQ
ncbi:46471_t:CDS:1, partial [Gigaspora margarita]